MCRMAFIPLLRGQPQLFEVQTIILGYVDNAATETITVWYKKNEVINNATVRNLTLTLKITDSGFYKCEINGKNSTNEFNMTVNGINLAVLRRDF